MKIGEFLDSEFTGRDVVEFAALCTAWLLLAVRVVATVAAGWYLAVGDYRSAFFAFALVQDVARWIGEKIIRKYAREGN